MLHKGLACAVTVMSLVGINLQSGALVLQTTDPYADCKPILLIALGFSEILDSLRYILLSWADPVDSKEVMIIVEMLGIGRAMYGTTMLLLAVDTVLKIKRNIHYNELKMHVVWKWFLIFFAICIFAAKIAQVCQGKTVRQSYVPIFTSTVIACAWIYMIVKVKRGAIAPASSSNSCKAFCVPRSTGPTVSESDATVEMHKGKLCKRLHLMITRYRWAISTPSLILLSYIPFVAIPSWIRVTFPNSFCAYVCGVADYLVMMSHITGYICDTLIYCYFTQRVKRRIRRMLIMRR